MSEELIKVDRDLCVAFEIPESDDSPSETASVKSSVQNGTLENGRRYQSLREQEYIFPCDEKQFECYEYGHLVNIHVDSDQENPLFRAPVADCSHILDIGTGTGSWAIAVADLNPKAVVRGVDLFPPPPLWIPPNCILEVDDVLKDWTWRRRFDLVHMRFMAGSFSEEEWRDLYAKVFAHLKPGGWIEQVEMSFIPEIDGGGIPVGSHLEAWGPQILNSSWRADRCCDTSNEMSRRIQHTGFININFEQKKWPIGPWPKDKRLKEIGYINGLHWIAGLEGWSLWLLTKFGAPCPWRMEEVQVYTAMLRAELKDPRRHLWHRVKRVWAQKPV